MLLLASLLSNASPGYELATHGLLTYKAYAQSRLQAGSPLRKDLGLEVYLADAVASEKPFGDKYFDSAGTDARHWTANTFGRDGQPFDTTRMVEIKRGDNSVEFAPIGDNLRLPGWLMRGAIREDDSTPIAGFFQDPPNPQDDPFGGVKRPLNHFYDPVKNKGLSLGVAAPAWALGVSFDDMFAATPAEDATRRNHFSVYDARETMYRALTGRSKAGTPVASDEATRRAYWATTFRALGDLAHMIQDMAQPQHTRNEAHNGLGGTVMETFFSGHASVYEFYIEARAKRTPSFEVDIGSTLQPVPIAVARPLRTNGYDTPRFNRYSDYFSTAQAVGVANGTGLADYSNRGFFTAGKNLLNSDYDLPNPHPSAHPTTVVSAVGWDGVALPGDFKLTLYRGSVSDTVNPAATVTDVPLVTVGVWDQFLQSRGKLSATMNYINYDANADLLIPRAVAYTTGLIDYFFRGQMEISLPDDGVYGVIDHAVETEAYTQGFRRIKLKLKNTTLPIVPSAGPTAGETIAQNMSGDLVAVVKFHLNACYRRNLSGEFGSQEVRSTLGDLEFESPDPPPGGCRIREEKIVVSTPKIGVSLSAGVADTTPLTFEFPTPIPVNAVDVYLQVVFRGVLGAEQDAVVVATKDISEPTQLTLVNVTDYLFCYNDNWYYKNEDGSLPSSIPEQFRSALRAQPYTASRVAFGANAGDIDASGLSKPLVVVNDLPPGQFARFAVLTERDVAFNDEIDGFYTPEPPPYKLHYPAGNQLTVQGTDLPGDPYRLARQWEEIGSFRNTRYRGLLIGFAYAGTGDCYIRPPPVAPALPWKPFPPEPGYAAVPSIKPVTVNFN
ncbi:MAG: hypothetical protein ABI537_09490 [Casimicrobiaceae bacterium]